MRLASKAAVLANSLLTHCSVQSAAAAAEAAFGAQSSQGTHITDAEDLNIINAILSAGQQSVAIHLVMALVSFVVDVLLAALH